VVALVQRVAERFSAFLTPEPNTGCLLFTGCAQTNGYGSFGTGDGKTALAHRFAWELELGPIPDGLTVDHRAECVLTCCNVRHMQLVSRERNSALASERLTHCVRGHDLHAPGVVRIRKDGRRACLACKRLEQRLLVEGRSEAEAEALARRDWPELYAAAERRVAGIVMKMKARSTLAAAQVSP